MNTPKDHDASDEARPAPKSSDPLQHIVAHCNAYKGADTRRSVIQLTVTAALFLALIAAMLASHVFEMWGLVALLALPASGMLVRLFIIQHDCGHGSYFRSRRANDMVGRVISLFTVTPYDSWRRAHNIHHAVSGNLDERGDGAIDTMTVREYLAMPEKKRRAYRFYRNPFVLFLFGSPFHVLVLQRIPFWKLSPFFEEYRMVPPEQVWRSIVYLDAAILGFYGAAAFFFGWHVLFTVCIPVIALTAIIGGWLFFIQHQFEHAYWEKDDEWKFRNAALKGSSYYDLPAVFQWFSGNIGLHHIHHLCPAIPNYRLQQCMDENDELPHMNRMTFWESLKCVKYTLWDEETRRMIGFRQLAQKTA